jgi:hypothetical protein
LLLLLFLLYFLNCFICYYSHFSGKLLDGKTPLTVKIGLYSAEVANLGDDVVERKKKHPKQVGLEIGFFRYNFVCIVLYFFFFSFPTFCLFRLFPRLFSLLGIH